MLRGGQVVRLCSVWRSTGGGCDDVADGAGSVVDVVVRFPVRDVVRLMKRKEVLDSRG